MYHYEIGQNAVLATNKFEPFLQMDSIIKVVYRDHKIGKDGRLHFQYGIKLLVSETMDTDIEQPMYMVQPQDIVCKGFTDIPRHTIKMREIPYCRRD